MPASQGAHDGAPFQVFKKGGGADDWFLLDPRTPEKWELIPHGSEWNAVEGLWTWTTDRTLYRLANKRWILVEVSSHWEVALPTDPFYTEWGDAKAAEEIVASGLTPPNDVAHLVQHRLNPPPPAELGPVEKAGGQTRQVRLIDWHHIEHEEFITLPEETSAIGHSFDRSDFAQTFLHRLTDGRFVLHSRDADDSHIENKAYLLAAKEAKDWLALDGNDWLTGCAVRKDAITFCRKYKPSVESAAAPPDNNSLRALADHAVVIVNTVEAAAHQRCLDAQKRSPAPGMANNPLHELIRIIDHFLPLLWACHGASTQERVQETVTAWNAETFRFLTSYEDPDDAIRTLADPAVEWCKKNGCADAESFSAVEGAAEFIASFALTDPPATLWRKDVGDDVKKAYRNVGERLSKADKWKKALRKLAGQTGDAWQPESVAMSAAQTNRQASNGNGDAKAAPLVPHADENAIVELYKTWKEWRDQLREAIQAHKDDEPETLCLAFNCWQSAERDTSKAKALAADPSLGFQADTCRPLGACANAADYHNVRVQSIISIINGDDADGVKGAAALALPILQRFAKVQFIDPDEIAARKFDAMQQLRFAIEKVSKGGPAPETNGKPAGGADDDAFRPAKEFLKSPFDTFPELKKTLKKNPWIRTKKPSRQRLTIHAGDWQKFLNQGAAATVDPLDLPAEMVDNAVKEVEERKAKERASKPKK